MSSLINGLDKDGSIISIERGSNGRGSPTTGVKVPLGRGLVEKVVERVNRQDKEKRGQWVPLTETTTMLQRITHHTIDQNS